MTHLTKIKAALNGHEDLISEIGLALETTPEAWSKLWEIPLLRCIAYIDVPARFNPYPLSMAGIDNDCPYDVLLTIVEYLSRFDASCLISLPGPGLSTSIVITFGTEDQIQYFFERFRSGPHWAFLAITEPQGGSDLSTVRSQVSGPPTEQRLNAAKIMIGGLRKASVGLVFAQFEGTQQS
jgi:diaminopimelate decarboxylase